MFGSRWDEARDALLEIAEYASQLNARSVSLRFMNCNIYDVEVQVRVFTTLHDLGLTFSRVQKELNRDLTALCPKVGNTILLYSYLDL